MVSTAEAAGGTKRGFEAIPLELRALPQWVCWKLKKRGKKTTKVPYRATNPFATAESDDPATWGTFPEAVAQFGNRARTGVDGVGFVFSPADDYVGIDLDDCLKDGDILPWAKLILTGYMPSYAEVSPSGRGVKIWVRGKLPGKGTRKADFGGIKGSAIEMYDCGRFFTTTGNFITPYFGIEDRADAVLSLYETIKPKSKGRAKSRDAGPSSPLNLTDSELVAKARAAKNGPKFSALYDGDIAGYASESEADFALVCLIAFWTGPDTGRIERIFDGSILARRGKWQDRPDYRERTIDNALQVVDTFYEPRAGRVSPGFRVHDPGDGGDGDGGETGGGEPEDAQVPEVIISTNEYATNNEACAALALDLEVYSRAGMLAEVIQEDEPAHKSVIRPPGALRVATMSRARIRDVLTRCAKFIKLQWNPETKDYDKIPTHPTDWCVSAVEARGHWPGVRPVLGIVETPILRPDGSILTEPGYDPSTFLFYKPSGTFPAILDRPTLEDARKAADELLGLVVDFPFVDASHKGAWLSAVLSPFARFATFGPVPLHYFDASCRGTGKSLLTDIIAVLMTGREMPRTIYTDDDDEMRKRITAVVLAGDWGMLLDNIDVPFGGASLDAMLTGMSWRDRILGVSQMTREMPLFACWYASGNNTVFKGDITRRVIYSRLEAPDEKPEERTDFQIKGELTEHVRANRGRLVAAVLTVLRAHAIAGRPDGGLVPMGSYGAWSKVVRSAIHWATGVDPYESAAGLKDGDPEVIARASLIAAWGELPNADKGVTTAEALKAVKENPARFDNLRTTFNEWSRTGDLPSSRSVGMRLNAMRGRVINNRRFRSRDAGKGTLAWSVEEVPGGTNGTRGTNPNPSRENFPDSNSCMDGESNNPDISGGGAGNSPTSPVSPTVAATSPFAGVGFRLIARGSHPETSEPEVYEL